MWGKKQFMAAAGGVLSLSVFLSGCAATTDGVEEVVITQQEEEQVDYSLAVASIQDVTLEQKIKCTYQQVKDEEISFAISGKRVTDVYVKEGDTVEQGQLLAVLTTGNLDREIEQCQYQIDRNSLLLQQALENQNMDIKIRKQQFSLIAEPLEKLTGDSLKRAQENLKQYENDIAEIQKNYRYQMEDYQDSVDVSKMRLEELQKEKNMGSLYAGMSGTVSYVKDNLKGSTSEQEQAVIKIIDDSNCIFVSENTEYKDYFTKEQGVEMVISSGSGAGTYELIPYQMENWGEVLSFTCAENTSDSSLEVGAAGQIHLVLDERKQVLAIPSKALHNADGTEYVYVLGENNIRETKEVTTGFVGNTYVEITAGLAEGDKVILK